MAPAGDTVSASFENKCRRVAQLVRALPYTLLWSNTPNNLETVRDFPSTPEYGQDGVLRGDFRGVICKAGRLQTTRVNLSPVGFPSDHRVESLRFAAQMPREALSGLV